MSPAIAITLTLGVVILFFALGFFIQWYISISIRT